MVEDRRKDYSVQSQEGDAPSAITGRPRGSGIIFALVAIALILAIGFFYLTKDKDSRPANAVGEAMESANSAAYVVGDAARNAADALRNHD